MLLKTTSLLLACIATIQLASAQYRDFTNSEGKSINAMPIKKTEDSVIVKTGTGKQYTLPFAVLSAKDLEFLKTWERPEFLHAIKDLTRKSFTEQTQADDCYIEVYQQFEVKDHEGKVTKEKNVAAFFSAQTEREVEQGLDMFSGITRHKEKFLKKNANLGSSYNLPLTSFSRKFPDGLNWSISVNDGKLTLHAKGHDRTYREYVKVDEEGVPYLLDLMTDIDANRMITSYMRTKNRN